MNLAAAASHWRRLIEEREEQTREVLPPGQAPAGAEQRVAQFVRSTREFQSDRLLELMLERAHPGSVVLDIGAGTGRHAIPLALAGASVIAVEPSEVMGALLRQTADEMGAGAAVTLVPQTWEDAETPDADLSLCSQVVYAVRDIVPFLDKMRAATRDAVFLAIRTTRMDAHIASLWRQVYGAERRPEPSFLDLYRIVDAMGIAANVETMPFGLRRGAGPGGGFASEDEAVESVRTLLFAAPGPALDRRIRAYLEERMERRDGRLYWKGPGMRSAVIWWTKADEPAYAAGR